MGLFQHYIGDSGVKIIMGDFIIQIGNRVDPQHIAQNLQNRPGVENRKARIWRFEWGSVVIQPPPGRKYEPFEKDGLLFACVGRPNIMDVTRKLRDPSGFCIEAADRWRSDSPPIQLLDTLTGMFVLLKVASEQITVVTDLLGSQPLYETTDRSGQTNFVGTLADPIANLAGMSDKIDSASIGELIVYDQISFPFTTFRHVRELEPGATHTWRIAGGEVHRDMHVYWQPIEPDSWLDQRTVTEKLVHAIRTGAKDIAQGSERIAVTLSGGRDSRAVLAALLRNRGVDAALTFCTRENRESRTAAQIAKASNVRHILVRRDPDFYGTVLARTMRLLGSEVRATVHGYAIVDNGLEHEFDVVIGGFLADTLLKDHFMPNQMRNRLRRDSLFKKLKHLIRRRGGSDETTSRWHASPNLLSENVRDQIYERRQTRLEQLLQIRPVTAAEWQGFYPISRQHDVATAWGNSRLFCADKLFYHRHMIEVAALLSPIDRLGGSVSRQAFERICGTLNQFVNANTGIPASANEREESNHRRELRQTQKLDKFLHLPASDKPWNDVHHSWANSKKLLLHSPHWKAYRRLMIDSRATEVLESILSEDGMRMCNEYLEEDDPRVQSTLVQVGLHVKNSLGLFES